MPIQVEPSSEFNLTTTRFAEDYTPDADTFADDGHDIDTDTFADGGHTLSLLFYSPHTFQT